MCNSSMRAVTLKISASTHDDAGILQLPASTLRKHRVPLEDGEALEFADVTLQADRGVVLAAVRRSGGALQFAGDALRRDRDIALEAVRQNWSAPQGTGRDFSWVSSRALPCDLRSTWERIKKERSGTPAFQIL